MTSLATPSARALVFSCAGVLALACLPTPAPADPWVPAAGDGTFEPMVRQYDATSAFPAAQFSSNTSASSEERDTMYRVTGVHGLGHRLSIEYDLRAGHLQKIRFKHNRRLMNSSSGEEDQEVGLNYGLRQLRAFADSVAVNFVASTGSTRTVPPLGTGQAAVEPDYQLGFRWGAALATLKTGPRVFLDGGAAQMRADMAVGIDLRNRIELTGTVFFVRTIRLRSRLAPTDGAEMYDLLRPGVRVKYRVSSHFKPFIAYEVNVAGRAIHAGRRISVGFAYDY